MANNKNWGNTPQESTTAGPGGWGSAPQESTTGAQGGWGSAPQESTTAGPQGGWGSAPQESTTGAQKPAAKSAKHPVRDVYVLNNVTFKYISTISDHSGEAIILKVENNGSTFALKLYQAGLVPNHEVLERIMNKRGNGLLIDIYGHGTWHDSETGNDFHYELMQYCEGESLASLNIQGDETKLGEIAKAMASAIDYAHSLGVLHRDVKPANFIWVDAAKTRFVLSDWGFAKTLDNQKRAQTDAGRTKIYAAPEMYTYIPGTPTYVGPKADFYSMGMSLLAMWKGEGLLLADETKLVHDKQEETLPYPRPEEMSSHSLGLIKALTRRNPDLRAGFDDVVRWAKGETIFTQTDDSLREFRIVFSATDNLIAHNQKELAKMMWENPGLATNYLYSDKIAKWLNDVDRPELAMEMENITEITFPGDRPQGLYAACLALDPTMPFFFSTAAGKVKVNTLEELGNAFMQRKLGSEQFGVIQHLNFHTWIATRDPVLAGKAIAARQPWQMIYSLFPDRGLDFRPMDTSRLISPEQIAEEIVSEETQNSRSGLCDKLDKNFKDSRIYGYLKSKGTYEQQLSWLEFCLNIYSADNKKKFVPYTYRVARLKAAAGLLGKIPAIKLGSTTFATLADVNPSRVAQLTADRKDILADWVSLFFQEDPKADYARKSYLERSGEYARFIHSNIPGCTFCNQYYRNSESFDKAQSENNSIWHRIAVWKWVATILYVVPLTVMIGICIYYTITINSLDFSESMGRLGSWIGIGLGILAGLACIGEEGNIIGGIIAGVIVWGITKGLFYFLGFIVPWFVIALMLVVLIITCKNIYSLSRKHLIDNYTSLSWPEVLERYFIGCTFNTVNKIFPSTTPSDYPECVVSESIIRGKAETKKLRRSMIMSLVLTIAGVALCWFTVAAARQSSVPQTSSYSQQSSVYDMLSGQFSGDINGTPATVYFGRVDSGDLIAEMSINYRDGVTRQTMNAYGADKLPLKMYRSDNQNIYLQIDSVYTLPGTKKIAVKGVYRNSVGNFRPVNLTKQ